MPHKETEAMDVQQHSGKDRTHRNHLIQPESRVAEQDITQQPDPLSAKLPRANGIGYGGSNDSLTDIVITNENALLLPNHVPVIVHKLDKETPSPLNGLSSTDTVPNGSPPVCTPPTASTGQRAPDSAHIPKANRHNKPHKKRPPSTHKSHQSLKTSASQIQEVAGDDLENPDIDTKSSAYNKYTIRQKNCCAHCVLACLFCELVPMCSALAQCLACGMECDALCCCGEACGDLAFCSGDPCTAVLDCAILEDCCQSSDCLEICLECCSICFPT